MKNPARLLLVLLFAAVFSLAIRARTQAQPSQAAPVRK